MWQNAVVDALGTKPVGFYWHPHVRPQEITLQITVYFVPYTG